MRCAILIVLTLALAAVDWSIAQDRTPVPATPTQTPQAARAQQDAAAKEQAKPVYDEKADAKQQIAAALARAKKENRCVLIQWGGNWCPWCVKLHALFQADRDLAKKLLYEYDVVYVDAGQPAGKNLDLATSYGADLKKHGFPYLTVLDADGKPLANQETSTFEKDGKDVAAGHDAKALLEFLTKHQAAYPDAQSVLAAGLTDAKKNGKLVFLHFGAPWCGWCHKLEDWMSRDAVRAVLAKDFVDVKIDTDRTKGGGDLLAKFAGGQPGIPWFAILDADGKALADSSREKGNPGTNIGFPAEKPEVEHFEKMLKQVARTMTADDIKMLVVSLTKNDPAK